MPFSAISSARSNDQAETNSATEQIVANRTGNTMDYSGADPDDNKCHNSNTTDRSRFPSLD